MVPRPVTWAVMDHDDFLRGDGLELRADAAGYETDYAARQ